MDWRDTGILLTRRKHGETSLILEVFTPGHGRHLGVLRGGASRRRAALFQPGAQLDLTWRARLEDHLGTFTAEPERSRAALAMSDPVLLAGLTAVTALLAFVLPERARYPSLYTATERLLDLLPHRELWPLAYLRWELVLLEEMGYGLDLATCAVTGAREGLVYVSPKSGRAVTQDGAGAYADRLLPLPQVLLGRGDMSDGEIARALDTTGWFLSRRLCADLRGRPPPEARATFVDRLARS